MPRYVRLAAPPVSAAPVEIDWEQIISALSGTLGGVTRLGGGLASLAGYGDLATGLGAVGGPLSLISGITGGNPLQALSGAATTGSTVSGLLGGPTISSLLADLAASVGLTTGATAGGTAGGAAAAGAGGGVASLAPAAAALPALLAVAGAATSAMEKPAIRRARQADETRNYAQDFPGLVRDRVEGASYFDTLGEARSPSELLDALRQTTEGVRASNLAPAYDTLSGGQQSAGIHGQDLSGWATRAPELEGRNWGAYVDLLDAGEHAGLDWRSTVLDAAPRGELRRKGPGTSETFMGFGGDPETRRVGAWQTMPISDYHTGQLDLTNGHNIDPSDWTPGDPLKTTQEAYDMSNAIAGIGGHLGIDWGARGADGSSQGYEIRPDELGAYGFTPGQYMPAILNYLKQIDPSVTESPNWAAYTEGLGDDPWSGLPQGLAPLAPKPKYKPPDPLTMGVDVGGGW